MNSSPKVSTDTGGAKTLADMLTAVPLLGECDSLETLVPLASYDRQAKGWLGALGEWLLVVLMATSLLSLIIGVLYLVATWLIPTLSPSVNDLMEGLGDVPLQLVVYSAAIAAVSLVSYFRLWPWLAHSTHLFAQRINLRVLLLSAISSQVKRNQALVGDNWRLAVCQTCLARLERFRVRFAYWRWLGFARCRKCHDDHNCYTGVRSVEGWLDRAMTTAQQKVGDAVRVNLLQRLPPGPASLSLDLEEVVVADAEDEEVETLILLYHSVQRSGGLPRARRMRCRLTGNTTVSLMGRRQLKQNFRLVN